MSTAYFVVRMNCHKTAKIYSTFCYFFAPVEWKQDHTYTTIFFLVCFYTENLTMLHLPETYDWSCRAYLIFCSARFSCLCLYVFPQICFMLLKNMVCLVYFYGHAVVVYEACAASDMSSCNCSDATWTLWYLKLQGAVSIRKTVLPGMVIPMLKIRRPKGRLIFNMEIAIRR